MKFVGGVDETARLKNAPTREKSSLVVMYDRRRPGKSTLIKRVLSENDIYFLADHSGGQHQRILFTKVIAQVFPDFDELTYPGWESMFRMVSCRIDKRFTLCLGEFPCLVEQSSGLPSMPQRLVDRKQLKHSLVLRGPSQNMMYGLFLDSTAPLYGHADKITKLALIRLPYIQKALSLNAMNVIKEYIVWGGMPRYRGLRENQNSLNDALRHNILSVNGTLYEEPIKLFQDDVKNIVRASTIVSYVGTGANRFSEIAAKCNKPTTNLSRPLKKLIDLGFLAKDVPSGVDEENAKKNLYKIADLFMAFYYQSVAPNRLFIELGHRLPIEQALTTRFSEYVSMQWEKLCRDAVTESLVNGVVYGRAKCWWGSIINENKKPEQVEFDVMAESLDKKYLLADECRWAAQENGKQLTTEFLRKANLLPSAKKYTVVPILFLKNAPKDEAGNIMLPEDVVRLSY